MTRNVHGPEVSADASVPSVLRLRQTIAPLVLLLLLPAPFVAAEDAATAASADLDVAIDDLLIAADHDGRSRAEVMRLAISCVPT